LSRKLVVAVRTFACLAVVSFHVGFILSVFLKLTILVLGATVGGAQVGLVVLGVVALVGEARLGLAIFLVARIHRYLHVGRYLLQLESLYRLLKLIDISALASIILFFNLIRNIVTTSFLFLIKQVHCFHT